jgi:acetoin utilization protein AcuB
MDYLLADLTIAEIMTPEPFTVDSEASIGTAARIMLEHRISGLPVIDAENNLVGIITESDIFSMVVTHEWCREEDPPEQPRPEVHTEED